MGEERAKPSEFPRARTTCVLLVEPDASLAQTIADVLQDAGYGCEIALSAAQASTIVEERGRTIDIIAIDVAAHHHGTGSLLDALANFSGGVFVLSGNRSDEADATARGLPFLLMPFDLDAFVAEVENQLHEPTRPGKLPRL